MNNMSILFDLDDTLIESGHVKKRAFKLALEECQLDQPGLVNEFLKLSGIPLFEVCESLGLPEQVPLCYRNISKELRDDISLYSGVLKMLNELSSAGLMLGIVTGRDRASSLEIMRRLDIEHFFHTLVTPDDIKESKPSPAPIYFACGLLSSRPENCIFVGDAINDMASAFSAGIMGIGCSWGSASYSELLEAGATIVVDDVFDLHKSIVKLVSSLKNE